MYGPKSVSCVSLSLSGSMDMNKFVALTHRVLSDMKSSRSLMTGTVLFMLCIGSWNWARGACRRVVPDYPGRYDRREPRLWEHAVGL